jgi:hypothetical protein
VSVTTLAMIAGALGVPVRELTAEVLDVEVSYPRAALTLTFHLHFDTADESKLIELIEQMAKKVTGTTGNPTYTAVLSGSVVVGVTFDWLVGVALVAFAAHFRPTAEIEYTMADVGAAGKDVREFYDEVFPNAVQDFRHQVGRNLQLADALRVYRSMTSPKTDAEVPDPASD